jgi:ergothioneine biosynthesis protein EgtB
MLTDIKHALWSMPLRPETSDQDAPFLSGFGRSGEELRVVPLSIALQWTEIPGGIYEIGHAGDGFAFDNEAPRHQVLLQDFQIASRQVTNAEYLEFINDHAYRRPELWLSDGWDAICAHSWNAPLYWEKHDSCWMRFTHSGLIEVDPAAPVCHVSYYEADAFARWSGRRLPTEAEWEIAALEGDIAVEGNLMDRGAYHPQAATASEAKLLQMIGDAWEWTASPYMPYPGYRPPEGTIGEYNGKFMANQMVLRGGAAVTPPGHVRLTYRNFFYPASRWAFGGIRLAEDA